MHVGFPLGAASDAMRAPRGYSPRCVPGLVRRTQPAEITHKAVMGCIPWSYGGDLYGPVFHAANKRLNAVRRAMRAPCEYFPLAWCAAGTWIWGLPLVKRG